ncbi:hypothetical protein MKX01_040723 [Papaver californicum]|nr:hypothetical protein MKX01_040723 [Papaver californicum]
MEVEKLVAEVGESLSEHLPSLFNGWQCQSCPRVFIIKSFPVLMFLPSVSNGIEVAEVHTTLTEMLMRQPIKLDSIATEGDTSTHRARGCKSVLRP